MLFLQLIMEAMGCMAPCLLLIFLLLRRIRHLLVCMYVNQRFSYNLLSNKKWRVCLATVGGLLRLDVAPESVSDEVRVGGT